MPTFVLVFRSPQDYAPGDVSVMSEWQHYFDKLGGHLVDAGNPVFSRITLGTTKNGTDLAGYSLITAPDAQTAMALAHDCPMLSAGGGVEVGELTLLNPTSTATTAADHATATASRLAG